MNVGIHIKAGINVVLTFLMDTKIGSQLFFLSQSIRSPEFLGPGFLEESDEW